MPTAILSVSDKTGIEEFASRLVERGWRLVSTGGTAARLREANVPVETVSELTGFPDLMGGRVKTLHPAVHAGVLARRSVTSDMEALDERGLETIDLVAANLYPFRETVARPDVALAEALEQVDVGGHTLLRAAAKNHGHVWAVCDADDYDRVIRALDADEGTDELRRRLASKVFRHTAAYDAAVAGYLEPDRRPGERPELPREALLSLVRHRELRYGENPDQDAALYRNAALPRRGIAGLRQLHGKDLSYNNLLDVDAGLRAVAPFLDGEEPAAAVIKHATPCGLAVGRSTVDAFRKAHACDPMSAFGSTVAFSEPVPEVAAQEITELFVECILAPDYANAALEVLQRKEDLRVLRPEEAGRMLEAPGHLEVDLELRGVEGGVLVQTRDRPAEPGRFRDDGRLRVATRRQPEEEEWRDLAFAWAAVQSVKSNAILLARDGATIGIGAGQMSRVDSVKISVRKATESDHETTGAVLASDAFFPFRDGIDAAAEAGIRAVVQPGGSVRDQEVVEAADEHDMAMVLTGRRLFRH